MRHHGLRDQAGDTRRVGAVAVKGATQRRHGGPSRVVPMRQPRITGYGGRRACCVITRARRSTPKAVGRVSFGALTAREILKGQPSGGHAEQASNTARGTPEVPADLRRYRLLAGSTGPKGPIARHATGLPWCREALRPVGPGRQACAVCASLMRPTPAFRAPSFFRRNGISLRTTGEPGARQIIRAAERWLSHSGARVSASPESKSDKTRDVS